MLLPIFLNCIIISSNLSITIMSLYIAVINKYSLVFNFDFSILLFILLYSFSFTLKLKCLFLFCSFSTIINLSFRFMGFGYSQFFIANPYFQVHLYYKWEACLK